MLHAKITDHCTDKKTEYAALPHILHIDYRVYTKIFVTLPYKEFFSPSCIYLAMNVRPVQNEQVF